MRDFLAQEIRHAKLYCSEIGSSIAVLLIFLVIFSLKVGRGGEGREGGRGGMTIIHIILMAPYTVSTE